MRQVTLKNIRANLTKELKDLPFEITKNGQVVAIVSGKRLKNPVKNLDNKEIKDIEENITTYDNEEKAHLGGRVEYYGAIPFRPYPKLGKR